MRAQRQLEDIQGINLLFMLPAALSTMSSPATSSLVPKTSRPSVKSSQTRHYRQTVYRNLHADYIKETCRRPKATNQDEPSDQTFSDWVLFPSSNTSVSRHERADSVLSPCRSPDPIRKTVELDEHVTVAKPRAKVAVEIHQSNGRATSETKPITPSYPEVSPPAKPRPARLPTPDLSDREEDSFCDCGIDEQAVELCKSC